MLNFNRKEFRHRFKREMRWIALPSLLIGTGLLLLLWDPKSAFQFLLAGFLLLAPSAAAIVAGLCAPPPFRALYALFIIGSNLVGELCRFYQRFPAWDLILHTLAGVLFAALGWSLCAITVGSSRHPILCALFALFFSISCGTFWEFFEYAADRLLMTDMQKDVLLTRFSSQLLGGTVEARQTELCGHLLPGCLDIGLCDTMEDMLLGTIGAAVYILSRPDHPKSIGRALAWHRSHS
ncbi:MAG: hypothetical protein IKL84_04355 [Clostridia bacterium]|nr:hypothetical protein [Clostridia bacterium]